MVHTSTPVSPRQLADQHAERVTDLDPMVAEAFGTRPGSDLVPDFSPDGQEAVAEAARDTLSRLDAVGDVGALDTTERVPARLLRERLTAALDRHRAGDGLRSLNNLMSPVQGLRRLLMTMPKHTHEDWAVVARRLRRVPESIRGYRAALETGVTRGMTVAPRQAETVVEQLAPSVLDAWHAQLVAPAPDALRPDLDSAVTAASAAWTELRDYLTGSYLPAAVGTPDAVGEERYLRGARHFTGSDLDLVEAYEYGWEEFHRLRAEMAVVAREILPDAPVAAVMEHLNVHGHAVEGEENIRVWLQEFMDQAIDTLDGTHFDLADRVRVVESMIAPPGGAAAPHYTAPSSNFSRPGRTWLPTLGETRFPTWTLVSIWYHEGVPGHHLQLAQWQHVGERLSPFQTGIGSNSAVSEGWALYAERFVDELGLLAEPAHRLGYLENQLLRAIRVIIDIGMHLRYRIPSDSGFHPGEVWTPELAETFLNAHSGMGEAFNRSEIVRYLGIPGQAISYKLGERAWLAGRDAARRAHAEQGRELVLKDWHMAAISMGALGLDDLADELAAL